MKNIGKGVRAEKSRYSKITTVFFTDARSGSVQMNKSINITTTYSKSTENSVMK